MTFPILNVLRVLALDPKASLAAEAQQTWYGELAVRHLRLSTYLVLALLYWYSFPWQFEKAATLSLDWIACILLRNIVVCGGLYGFWHWFLYENQMERVKHLKFNPRFPSQTQHTRDRWWSLSGLTISSGFEVAMMYLWASGAVPFYTTFWSRPLWSVAHLLVVSYWRDFHFYVVHRMMHPWFRKPKSKGRNPLDIGAFLYKHVHSLHHKSYNTGPWSGLAMHPVEHLLYYSCTLLPLIFTLHPLHFLFNKLHADVSPLPGHDGFDKPGGGSHFHYIHHAHYEYNYGTPMVPLDKVFGTYNDGSQWQKPKADDASQRQH
eukprot:m.295707 g.295707  ORF g.295707 m.295707 type:complete len:319 (-) comp19516_c1_seq8:2234-3190(-)